MSAFALHVFVSHANFAPSGIDGIATMSQEISGINMGIFSLIFNLPLLIAALFILKRRYVIYTLIFTFSSSGLLILCEVLSIPYYVGDAQGIIAAIFSGIILGLRTGIMLKIGASTEGVDIIAGMVQMKMPHVNTERIITVICYAIILSSYLVYREFTSLLMSFVQMFIFDKFASYMLKDTRNAVEVKIITKEPEKIKHDIIYILKYGATVVDGHGMYTDGESCVII